MSAAASLPDLVLSLLNALRPAPQAVNARERLRVVVGAFLGLLLAGLLSRSAMPAALPWLVAPLGASAVLVFGVPASPLAQPWAVVGGNTLSALVGIACMAWLPLPPLAMAAVAVALAIATMFLLRCLHPPGGAAALLMVLTATRCCSNRIKALPVVDRVQRIVGIVTRADFMRAAEGQQRDGLAGRLQLLLRPSPSTHSTKPEVVGQIMSRQVRVASAERPIAELVPLFSATGHHHIPIVGEQARLVGILTQSDLVKALSHGP